MSEAVPPWNLPAVKITPAAGREGVTGKPLETMGRKARGWGAFSQKCEFCVTLVRLHFANQWKRWDCKARG